MLALQRWQGVKGEARISRSTLRPKLATKKQSRSCPPHLAENLSGVGTSAHTRGVRLGLQSKSSARECSQQVRQAVAGSVGRGWERRPWLGVQPTGQAGRGWERRREQAVWPLLRKAFGTGMRHGDAPELLLCQTAALRTGSAAAAAHEHFCTISMPHPALAQPPEPPLTTPITAPSLLGAMPRPVSTPPMEGLDEVTSAQERSVRRNENKGSHLRCGLDPACYPAAMPCATTPRHVAPPRAAAIAGSPT